ncbi:TauD/TfdA family dioxygenase [Sphingomonas sp. BIUV-7]|uniref:TauD/TfdA family dioxygenase n=1 Tax=Sphingomonas natans TaxID=3063330 RepID=A0ABT8Y8D8_9SPHN|nr:TauD/TfdA family dioxygenase [Sphingomonas sp. BIUV-7]MDO6414593.1 TauD/TfdA family dioxygenase [Sphingomonas sp. BIUV-7]
MRQEADNPFGRGYISNTELSFHNDFHETLSLAYPETATKGGESGLASSLAIHNILLVERPDLLEALYTGWYDGLEAFYRIFRPRDALARTFVPYYSVTDDVGSFHGLGAMFNDRAAAEQDESVPALLVKALAAVRGIAHRPGVGLWFSLQPGEMIFWHNWTLLHTRTAFENAPGRERELLRLWLRPHCRRVASPVITQRADAVDRIHATDGISPSRFGPAPGHARNPVEGKSGGTARGPLILADDRRDAVRHAVERRKAVGQSCQSKPVDQKP